MNETHSKDTKEIQLDGKLGDLTVTEFISVSANLDSVSYTPNPDGPWSPWWRVKDPNPNWVVELINHNVLLK